MYGETRVTPLMAHNRNDEFHCICCELERAVKGWSEVE